MIKAAFLCREQEKKTQAVASMVIDRVLGLLGLFVLAGPSGAFAWAGAAAEVRRLIVFAWVMVGVRHVGLAILFTPALYRPLIAAGPRPGEARSAFERTGDDGLGLSRAAGRGVPGAWAWRSSSHALFVVRVLPGEPRALFATAGAVDRSEHYLVVPLILLQHGDPDAVRGARA